MAQLTPAEITNLISEATLRASMKAGMTSKARVCLVYEEAHTLIPEWNSVAAEGDRTASNGTARAILQGRKYGLGCLLITQRTANVTKTILNQCHTIFAMRTFDDTGREFLANYLGKEHAAMLPALEERHAILFGKASSCETPVLIRLNDRDEFTRVFRGPVQTAPENGPAVAEQIGEGNGEGTRT
jgi:DNA helicase HerA-like ATPase